MSENRDISSKKLSISTSVTLVQESCSFYFLSLLHSSDSTAVSLTGSGRLKPEDVETSEQWRHFDSSCLGGWCYVLFAGTESAAAFSSSKEMGQFFPFFFFFLKFCFFNVISPLFAAQGRIALTADRVRENGGQDISTNIKRRMNLNCQEKKICI